MPVVESPIAVPTERDCSGHGHASIGDHDHEHLPRNDVEQNAIEEEGKISSGERIYAALRRLVVDSSILTANEIRDAIEKTETMSQTLLGRS